jgi:UDP-GlcNAc:undecaprenyl-phosphate/decaprenyl-phosphate GlcNAc-1-phosphate transferase
VYNFTNLSQIILTLPVSFLLTKVTVFFSKKVGFVNHPNPIVDTHKLPTAYGGGLAIGITIILFLSFQIIQNVFAFGYLILVILLSLIGLSDDLIKFNPLQKLLSQLLTLIPFVVLYSDVWPLQLIIFSLFILVSQNAWNLVDVMDGLISGVSIIVFLSMSLILLLTGNQEFTILFSATIGMSVLGFLFWNKHPAKIFLGETGTILLGSLFAIIVINSYLVDTISGLFLLLLGIVPFFELFFLIIVRTRKGIPFYRGSPDHFSLRMLNNGYSVNSINKIVILFSGINSTVIVLASITKSFTVFLICCGFEFLVTIFAYNYFNSLPARNDRDIIESG